ncbi:micronuclear linker histone polyprotein isoform X6 [Halyomorpha halys]|uniref:micronuclear linker histone polyprotein isoform X6 n=1 Tax=Halyomorpha halys TaxID=286706 RepID=UPI0034D365E2
MPHLIVSTVSLLSNLYKNAPLIVGDKDSDPDLMRFLGARITTNYPACGSPPMYVMHAPPRTVFDNLEKRGYCLMSAQTIQEHSVWILARPRVPDDDKVEIARGGPNDKSIQAFDESQDSSKSTPKSPTRSPRPSRSRSPTKIPRITITRSSSKESVKDQISMNPITLGYSKLTPASQSPLEMGDRPLISDSLKQNSQVIDADLSESKSSQTEKKSNFQPNDASKVVLSVQILDNDMRQSSSNRGRKVVENQKLGVQPNRQILTVQEIPSGVQIQSISAEEKLKGENPPPQSQSATSAKRINSDQDISPRGRSSHKDKKYSSKRENSKKMSYRKKDAENVTSRGDAGTFWLGNEKVHMGIQASVSDISLKKCSDIMSRVTFNPRKHTELLKNLDESTEDISQSKITTRKSALKSITSSSKEIQADLSCDPLIKPRKSGISVHFAKSKEGLVVFDSASSLNELSKIIELNDYPTESSGQYNTNSKNDPASPHLNAEELGILKEASVFKESIILKSLASRCSHIAIVDDVGNPMLIDITDPYNLTCLTEENCCCEDK